MRIRRQLVQQRTGLINLLRAVVRQEGLQVASGKTELVLAKLDQLPLSPVLQATLAPLRTMIAALNETIAAVTAGVAARAAADPGTQRLMTVPGVGPILAVTFQAVLDTPARFGGDASRASSFVGVVPSEASSAERQHKGRITKTGSGDLRALLTQASWAIFRSRSRPAARLRDWVHALAARRGRAIAIVALCRRLTRILYAMWRDQTVFTVRDAVAA
jgi:transposase